MVSDLFLEELEKTKENKSQVDAKASAIFEVEHFILELSKPVVSIY